MQILAPRDLPGADPGAALVANGTGRVRFDARPDEFRVRLRTCPNPACACTDAQLQVASAEGDVTFPVDLRLEDGAPLPGKPELPPALAPLAEEARRDLPAAVREGTLRRLRALRQAKPKVAGLAFAPAWGSHDALVPFSHLLGGGLPADDAYLGLYDQFEHEGGAWSVQDLFCPRKKCDCREVLLHFQRSDTQGVDFGARMSLRTGELEIETPRGVDDRGARAVVRAWQRASPERGDRRVLMARYEALRALARQPLRG